MNCTQKGKYAERVVEHFVDRYKRCSLEIDKQGTDGMINNLKCQVKHDETIPKTGNLYYEVEEKSNSTDEWRPSPSDADIYFFVYPGSIIRVLVKDIKNFVKSKKPITIKPTSRGHLIPLFKINHSKKGYPYIDCQGFFRIPFDSDDKYCWWKENGQRLAIIEQEVNDFFQNS